MVDNYFQRIYFILIFLLAIMMSLIGLLLYEYSFLCQHVKELKQLQECYEQQCLLYKKADTFMNKQESLCDEDRDCVKEKKHHYYSDTSKTSVLINDIKNDISADQWIACVDEIASVNTPQKEAQSCAAVAPMKTLTIQKKPIKDLGFIWPIEGNKFWLSSLYGPRKRINGRWGFHHGVDMAAVKGTRVKSVRAGHIVEAGFQPGYGNTVVVQHSQHLKTRYAHLNTLCVRSGQKVGIGALVGTVGETGFIRKKGKDGSHLHFEVYEKGKRINPLDCLPRLS
jgi:hypothetical protein